MILKWWWCDNCEDPGWVSLCPFEKVTGVFKLSSNVSEVYVPIYVQDHTYRTWFKFGRELTHITITNMYVHITYKFRVKWSSLSVLLRERKNNSPSPA